MMIIPFITIICGSSSVAASRPIIFIVVLLTTLISTEPDTIIMDIIHQLVFWLLHVFHACIE